MTQNEIELEEFEKSLNKRRLIPWFVVLGIFVAAAGVSLFFSIFYGISKAIGSFFGQAVYLFTR